MTTRRLPRWSELKTLIRPQPIQLNPVTRRLSKAVTINDLRQIARRQVPKAVFDYVDGAAEEEISLQRAREAFRRVEFLPSILQDVSKVDTSTTILGKRSELPLIFAPTGFTRMMNHEGEIAVGKVANRAGIPYAISTMGTTSLEVLAETVPNARRWFQLYLWKDRAASRDLIARAAAAGYEALVLTVDTPIAGSRQRDVRNGLTIPPALTLKTMFDSALHPEWWINMFTTEPLSFASLNSWNGTVAELVAVMFDPSASFADLEWLRNEWKGSLVVKGIQNIADAKKTTELGADAIVVSNHGGRQLDRAPTPLEQLPRIVEAVGDKTEIYLDGGILSGADILAAVGLGARACMVGRAYLYGLMAGGERGVQRATDILSIEMHKTLQLLGIKSISELNAERVRIK
ncbi:MAG: alpha-hydroxy-acid oxidizing protein [Chloroflexi bacterium]|uniref:Alpha-hydroxy-acid oxidizing protein n=1 Tax=Candidatus Chlorohelix allophototropha TaxID=3003348 RepID=A0A8T7M7D4_9CHLR|nr:alpha-hydroxy-acid oxidizing protein [Chloroflexota bacterium]WJW69830.1 alpha-hydroxy-acid oxidizing protein [Chloroflexota bacterium L227-S17]